MSKTRTLTLGIFFAFVVLLLFLPLPPIVLEILVGIEFATSVGLLLYALKSKSSKPISSPILMPRAVLGFSLFSLAVNIGLVRAMLTGLINTDGIQIPLISFLAETVCRGNCVIGIILILVLFVLAFFLLPKILHIPIEVAAKVALDSMITRFFKIDSKLNNGKITEEKAKESKREVQKEADFYSAMYGASKFLSGNAKAIIVLTIVSIMAGIAIEVYQNEKVWLDAANSAIPLVAGNAFFFVIPLLVVSFAMWLCVTLEPSKKAKRILGTYEGKASFSE